MTALEKLARRLKAAGNDHSADVNGDKKISPKELHEHFDADHDGTVDMKDYAKHIALHTAHPEWLAKETAEVVAEQEGIPAKSAMAKLAARLKNPEGGLTAAGRRHYAKTEGANLRPGVKNPDEAGDSEKKRWARWATRFYSNPRGPMTNDKGEPTRLALMANAWGTKVPKTREEAQAIAARGHKILDAAREKKAAEGHLDKNDPDVYITEDGRRTRRGLWANVALKKKREKRSAYEDGTGSALSVLGLEKAADDVIYKTRFSGIPVHVDRPKGTKKTYRLHGKTTNITYRNDYGFIPGIKDHDGMELDVHLGPNKKSDKVFLVQKLKGPPDKLEFDEHKVLLGYDSRQAARNVADYYFSKIRSKNMRQMTIPEFKDLIKKGPIPKP